MNVQVFILAGGTGERFWPMSRACKPKHLLRLFSERTLLEETAARLDGLVEEGNLHVLTQKTQLDLCREVLPGLPPGNVMAEPERRDTAPAAALATAWAGRDGGDPLVVLLPSDARIQDSATFRRQLRDALRVAQEENCVVTFGIPPRSPNTAYGYLKLGADAGKGAEGSALRRVEQFTEKPDFERATEYVASGDYAWNAGIFVWKRSVFLAEAKRQQPALAEFVEHFPDANREEWLAENFDRLPRISLDYALMEGAREIRAVAAEFDWDDLGSWNALPDHFEGDADGNTFHGDVVGEDCSGNIVLSSGRTVALCGVRDLVVVETEDAVLVCHRDAAPHLKKLHAKLPPRLK